MKHFYKLNSDRKGGSNTQEVLVTDPCQSNFSLYHSQLALCFFRDHCLSALESLVIQVPLCCSELLTHRAGATDSQGRRY